MRTPICCAAAAALLALAALPACGDGLLFQLPEDGTWAQYDYDLSVKVNGGREQAEGLIRLASVGRVTEKGQPCRWIEFRIEMKPEKEELETAIMKLLVPERHLKKGENPLDHVVRGWVRSDEDKPPKELEDPGKLLRRLPYLSVLGKPLENQRELAATTVRSKLGSLSCKGVEGTLELRVDGNDRLRMKAEQRLHSKAPFGVVDSHGNFEFLSGGQVAAKASFDLKLADFGTGAKSEMPEQK